MMPSAAPIVRTTEYVYQIATRDEEELLAYHWTLEAPTGFRLYPHLHIGLVSIAKMRPFLNSTSCIFPLDKCRWKASCAC